VSACRRKNSILDFTFSVFRTRTRRRFRSRHGLPECRRCFAVIRIPGGPAPSSGSDAKSVDDRRARCPGDLHSQPRSGTTGERSSFPAGPVTSKTRAPDPPCGFPLPPESRPANDDLDGGRRSRKQQFRRLRRFEKRSPSRDQGLPGCPTRLEELTAGHPNPFNMRGFTAAIYAALATARPRTKSTEKRNGGENRVALFPPFRPRTEIIPWVQG